MCPKGRGTTFKGVLKTTVSQVSGGEKDLVSVGASAQKCQVVTNLIPSFTCPFAHCSPISNRTLHIATCFTALHRLVESPNLDSPRFVRSHTPTPSFSVLSFTTTSAMHPTGQYTPHTSDQTHLVNYGRLPVPQPHLDTFPATPFSLARYDSPPSCPIPTPRWSRI